MKKILIITYYYKHKNAMASVRAIKLAKFFAAQGHDVTVLTSNQIDTWTKDYLTPEPSSVICEIYAPQHRRWTLIRKYLAHRKRAGEARQAAQAVVQTQAAPAEQAAKKSLKARLRSYLGWLFYFNLAKQEDICMYKGLKAEFKRQKLGAFDTVIATYPTYGAFLTGIWLKKRNYCNRFIADFRDPLYNPGFRSVKAEADYDKRCLAKVMKSADKVVCVSEGIAEGIAELHPKEKSKLFIITNGFDSDDVKSSESDVRFAEGKIHFVYTGTLYHGKRCVDMLAQVLEELIKGGDITRDSFAFEYAGPDFEELLVQLSAYGLENTAVNHGFVSREQAIALQKAADALLLLTWNESNYRGVVPGKLYEYMAIGNVPIIALVTGDVAQSEVALKIKETSSGIACEQANMAADKATLKQYLKQMFAGNNDFSNTAEKYNYQNIAKQYLELM